jgi:hypothetical protein
VQRSVLKLCTITSNSTESIAVYAAATLSIGTKIAKRGSVLAAGLLLDPRQRGDRRLAGTVACRQYLQDPRIQRQRRLSNLPLQPVLIHHLPQPGYRAEKIGIRSMHDNKRIGHAAMETSSGDRRIRQ